MQDARPQRTFAAGRPRASNCGGRASVLQPRFTAGAACDGCASQPKSPRDVNKPGYHIEDGRVHYRDPGFPLKHLQASRMDAELQARMRERVSIAKQHGDVVCPDCGNGSAVCWFYFVSPPWTWEHLCGRAGIVAYCDLHKCEIAFLQDHMN